MTTSTTIETASDRRRITRQLAWFVGLALGLTWIFNNLLTVGDDRGWWSLPDWLNAFAVAMFGGPSTAGLVMAITGGRSDLRDLFSRVVRAKTTRANYLLAILLPAVPPIAALGIGALFGASTGDLPGVWPEWWTVFALFLVLIPVAEEFGWRAYALPRLLRVATPMRASIILGSVWGLWHLPAAFLANLPQGTFFFDHEWMWLAYLPLTISQSVLMTWLFNRTGGSALLSGFIFHAGVNAWAGVLLADATLAGAGRDPGTTQLWIVIVTTMLLATIVSWSTKGRLGAPSSYASTQE